MRTYGRDSTGVWVQVTGTSYVAMTSLIQELNMVQGENPLYDNYGIPSFEAVITQVAPDAAVANVQSHYAQYFTSLQVYRLQTVSEPTYQINAVYLDGTVFQTTVYT